MKKILLTLVLMVGVVLGLFAQNLTYQAAIRDNSHRLVTNTAVKATVTITFTTGTPATYSEEVNGTTNLHGLLTFEFGNASLIGRDFEGATITTTVKSADESTVYVDNLTHPVSAMPYALSVNGQSIQNYLTANNYVDLAKLEDTLGAYSTTDVLNGLLQQLEDKIAALSHKVDSLAALIPGGDTVKFTCGTSTVKDYDNNEYNTVQIGSQCWMKENLRTTKYANGDDVSSEKKFNPNSNADNVATYGLLYTWSAATRDSSTTYPAAGQVKVQGICPNGWHVPSNAEWTQLTDYVNTEANGYRCNGDGTIANALSAATGWQDPNECRPGHSGATLNATDFSAVPAGWYDGSNHFCKDFRSGANFWSATQNSSNYSNADYRNLSYSNAGVNSNSRTKANGYSVRCLRN